MGIITKYPKKAHVQLTPSFNSNEFDCPCNRDSCKETLIDLDHVKKLQKLRDDLNAPIHIDSATRCLEHNTEVGGEPHSQHMLGHATDIKVVSMTPDEVADACEGFDGLGRYNTFTHVDSRGSKARWDFRTKPKVKESDVSVSDKDL